MAYTNGHLDISSGDIRIVPSDAQHVEDTINAFPGWWKQFPFEGFGVSAWLGGPGLTQEIQKGVRLNLSLDGYNALNPKLAWNAGKLIIDPNVNY
jgi:hypothetical protein